MMLLVRVAILKTANFSMEAVFHLLDPDPYIDYRSGSRWRFEYGTGSGQETLKENVGKVD